MVPFSGGLIELSAVASADESRVPTTVVGDGDCWRRHDPSSPVKTTSEPGRVERDASRPSPVPAQGWRLDKCERLLCLNARSGRMDSQS